MQLRSKRDLIEKFIADYLPNVSSSDSVEAGFNDFWSEEREKSGTQFCDDEGLKREDIDSMIKAYHFTQKHRCARQSFQP